ncbi:hypothetical protein GCM10022225_82930 [Plantactinospora mayteni]
MSRRVFRPAVDGNPQTHTGPVIEGMHFHDLRHTHKTWMIEDAIPEIAQARRLGHRLPGIRGIYSHVTPSIIADITRALEDRWQTTQPDNDKRRHLRGACNKDGVTPDLYLLGRECPQEENSHDNHDDRLHSRGDAGE